MTHLIEGLAAVLAEVAARLAAAGLDVPDEPAPDGETVWRLELERAKAGAVAGEAEAGLAVIHETAAYRGVLPGLTALGAAAAALDRRRIIAGGLTVVPLWQGLEFQRDAAAGRRVAVLRLRLMVQREG